MNSQNFTLESVAKIITLCVINFIGRFILCDEDDGLYEAMDIDPYDPEADEKREELKLKRQKELLSQVDFDK